MIAHDTPAARECWSPARTERLSRRTVKRISSGSENRNLTDALEQQRPRLSGRGEVRGSLLSLDRKLVKTSLSGGAIEPRHGSVLIRETAPRRPTLVS